MRFRFVERFSVGLSGCERGECVHGEGLEITEIFHFNNMF